MQVQIKLEFSSFWQGPTFYLFKATHSIHLYQKEEESRRINGNKEWRNSQVDEFVEESC